MKNYDHYKKIFDSLIDMHGNKIDSGIKEAVILLNCHNIITLGSCHGHINHGCDYPWIHVDISSVDSLESMLNKAFKQPRFEIEKLCVEIGGKYVAGRLMPIKKELKSGRRYFKLFSEYLKNNSKP